MLTRIHTDTQTHRHTDTHTHRHTDTQTHRHTDTQTHRHTDRQTHRHTDTQTDTQTDCEFLLWDSESHNHSLSLSLSLSSLCWSIPGSTLNECLWEYLWSPSTDFDLNNFSIQWTAARRCRRCRRRAAVADMYMCFWTFTRRTRGVSFDFEHWSSILSHDL